MSDERDRQVFVEALRALGDHLAHVVLVGGWAHQLHRQLDGIDATTPSLYTQDMDFAVRRPPPPVHPPLDQRLVKAGFREHLKGETGGITEYVWAGGGSAISVEFLVQRTGNERAAPLDIGGARAQRLRYLHIAFLEPCKLSISAASGFPVGAHEELCVHVTNPAAFLANKLLTYQRRTSPAGKAKDLLYMFDTFRMFAPVIETLREHWTATSVGLSKAEVRGVHREHARLVHEVDVADEASRIADSAGRPATAQRIMRTCIHGLDLLLA